MFYLVLRGLDTIEDDMTIPDEKKQPLLRSFHEELSTPGWTFMSESGPDEKDRQLLVEFDNVVTEMGLLKPEYREIITDICHKMEIGMADYTHRAATLSSTSSRSTLTPSSNANTPSPYLESITEHDLYCHYVAGLVGEGLSRLFAASGKEVPWLGEQLTLSNSIGLLLQKTNILRDIREDVDQEHYFWPRELWGVYKPASEKTRPPGKGEYFGFETPEALVRAVDVPGDLADRAMWTLSAVTLDALRHATDALDYLPLLKNQRAFRGM
ncbi:bifunctional farnesyl-diphosphate farnesyltransferase/squalene synthase [Ceratobasidium sp. 392]|nr:bifunctional farnesyl-diphosphate farnesyltransferase/squalene synthase [Ceratobasidium sp. 392]